ncbi:MAG TPA: phosphate ABC transporter permease, partial [Anaerolineae bacterium]|nr:phosphate ABC transporter permease [Anaerolineae bacterium]
MNFKKKHFERRHLIELFIKTIMRIALIIVASSLGLILWTIISRGLPSLTWDMVTQIPKGGYYMGKEGGILNAIIGSIYLASGGTLIAIILSLPIALYLQAYAQDSKWGDYV